MNKILKLENIEKFYGNKTSLTKAVDDISLEKGKVSLSLLPR